MPAPNALYTWDASNRLADSAGGIGTLIANDNLPVYDSNCVWSGSGCTKSTDSAYFSFKTPAWTLPATSFSVCFWLRPNLYVGFKAVLSLKGENRMFEFDVIISSDRFLKVPIRNDVGQSIMYAQSAMQVDVWKHHCITYDGNTWKLYENGVYTASISVPIGGAVTLNYYTAIGGYYSKTGRWEGSMDEFRFFFSTLSGTDVSAIYNYRGPSCTICPLNSYCLNSAIYGCPLNSSSLVGSTSCICNTGYYWNNGTCTICAAGTYSALVGSAACAVCPFGTYSTGGAASCTPCAANANSGAGASRCTCNTGYYDCDNGTTCIIPADYYVPPVGLTGYTNTIHNNVLYEVRNYYNSEAANPQWYVFDNNTATGRYAPDWEYCLNLGQCSANSAIGSGYTFPGTAGLFLLDGVMVPYRWVELYTSKPVIVTKLALYNVNWYQQWILCGSNDNTNWYTIFTKSNIGVGYAYNVWNYEPISPIPAYNATRYSYLRIAVVRIGAWQLTAAEVQFWTNSIYDYPIPAGFAVVNGAYVNLNPCAAGYFRVGMTCQLCAVGSVLYVLCVVCVCVLCTVLYYTIPYALFHV